MFKQSEKGQSTVGTILSVIAGLVVAGLLIFAFGYFILGWNKTVGKEIRKTDRQIEREVNQTSQQYVETQSRAMRDQINKYNDLETQIAQLQAQDATGNAAVIQTMRTQQRGIVSFVETQAQTLPDNAVPSDIRQFLSAH